MTAPSPDTLLIPDALEAERLERRIAKLARAGKPNDRLQARLDALVERSTAVVERRAARVPEIRLPEALPITDHGDDVVRALAEHRVLVVAGETGSGKTTQLPKLALAAGCGVRGRIGHTQPRRIAARSVAGRIAEELGESLGDRVGFQTRFEQNLGDDALVKLMTDGILLAETRSDPDLLAYDCLIIDEAHERSLNIDFLLGYLARLLERRRDLKVIITSATIDVERFAAHFAIDGVPAPVIEVSGRTFPVAVRWLPPESLPEADTVGADDPIEAGVFAALAEIRRLERAGEGTPSQARDLLVFLPGEREIRDLARALRERLDWPGVEVLPLYARLSASDQQRVFAPGGARRIVLATNVAETSLTVPRIGYVIDPGLARISRYSFRSKLQRLPIEAISQASANQRAGRCGRLAPGICFRLYGEDDFAGRDAFTDPEILRTNLAAVVLQMAELGLGDPERFPFLQPPDPRALSDGRRLLAELGALDAEGALTRTGRELAGLPLDPRLGRMVLAARDRDCLAEVLVIVSALAGGDPRERPGERQQAADRAHADWVAKGSDFLAYVKLWRWLESRRGEVSNNALRRECGKRFLSWLRILEWRALHRQLHLACRERGWRENRGAATDEAVHRALLPGLLSQIGVRTEKKDYLGARGLHFHVFPGSSLFASQPPWLMAAEIVETSRVYARTNAAIDPSWIEPEATHLVRRHHDAPHWRRKQGRVVATERVTLYGLPVVEGRTVPWAPIDPEGARQIFLLDGLARGGLQTSGAFMEHNLGLVEAVRDLEARERRRDLLVPDEALASLYDGLIPAGICDARSFERWRRDAEAEDARALFLTREQIMRGAPEADAGEDFPGTLALGDAVFELAYAFSPGAEDDGVTVRVPRAALPQLRSDALEWLVPGLLEEKCVALVKALPKRIRRQLAPVPDHVAELLPQLRRPDQFRAGTLRRALTQVIATRFEVDVPADAWDAERLETHLRMRIEVLDEDDAVVAAGRDLSRLQAEQGAEAEAAVSRSDAVEALETSGCTDWSFGTLPERLSLESGVQVHPGLVDEGASVGVRAFRDPLEAEIASRAGVVRLLLLAQNRNVRHLKKQLSGGDRLKLMYAPLGGSEDLLDGIARLAARRAHLADGALPRDRDAFRACLDRGRGDLAREFESVAELTGRVLEGWHAVRSALAEADSPAYRDSTDDVAAWLAALVPGDVLDVTPVEWLEEVPRYLEAAQRRLVGLQGNVERDRTRIVELAEWSDRVRALASAAPSHPLTVRCRWLLEEYRVSLFAQNLGTRVPVSAKRLRREFAEAEREIELDGDGGT